MACITHSNCLQYYDSVQPSRVTLDIYDLQLRVTRPGFIQGIRVLAESDAPVPHLQSVERWRQG